MIAFSNMALLTSDALLGTSSKLENLQRTLDKHSAAGSVKFVVGDLLSREDCQTAVQDVSVIIHLAAGFDKSFAGAFMNSALTTRNLLDAFLELWAPQAFCEC